MFGFWFRNCAVNKGEPWILDPEFRGCRTDSIYHCIAINHMNWSVFYCSISCINFTYLQWFKAIFLEEFWKQLLWSFCTQNSSLFRLSICWLPSNIICTIPVLYNSNFDPNLTYSKSYPERDPRNFLTKKRLTKRLLKTLRQRVWSLKKSEEDVKTKEDE